MKASTLLTVLLALVCCLLVAEDVRAQGGDIPEGPSIDGYTSIDYDPDTNTVIAYSETSISHYGVRSFYDAYVYMYITNDSGAILANEIGEDYTHTGFTWVTAQVAGDPATTYTANARHKARTRYYDEYYEDFYPYRYVIDYWDDYFFGFFEGQSIYQQLYYQFFRPGTDPITRRSPYINLGSTYDSASVTTPRKPHHLKIVDDVTERKFCGQLERRIIYQVVDFKGRPVGKVPLKELFPGTIKSSCDGATVDPSPCSDEYTDSNGVFTDYLRSLCIVNDEYCGAAIDPNKWQWCPPGRTSITLGSMIYRIRHIEITVNGLDKLPLGGHIYPSGLMTYR
ncbi:MAG: hypothetical protein ABR577_01160 [Pyrinomonadaceae bacterium]